MNRFSFARTWAVFVKEFQQILRDRLTFGMAVGIPILQLVLFGYAINSDPKQLPTAVVTAEQGPLVRSLVTALQHTQYFRVVQTGGSEAQADEAMARGQVQFIVVVPPGFERDLLRGQRPTLFVAADATDPAAAGNAIAALGNLAPRALAHDLQGALRPLAGTPPPYEVRVHRRYNPEGLSRFNIVPGLIGTILTMTMIMFTGLAMTRERERGTMENLLATPVRPAEVMLGKIAPYVVIGYVQLMVILGAAWVLFAVPMVGSRPLLGAMIGVFIVANLAVGFTFSTLARNQLQAVQMTLFFFLPSMLLSGFMFPFAGMPAVVQWIAELLPLTHFLRLVRGIMLRGASLWELWPDVLALVAFTTVMMTAAILRFRKRLD